MDEIKFNMDMKRINAQRNSKKYYKLKYWREKLGLKQEDIGVLLGCKKSNYCEKENGKTEITLKEVLIIKKAFNKLSIKMGYGSLMFEDIFEE